MNDASERATTSSWNQSRSAHPLTGHSLSINCRQIRSSRSFPRYRLRSAAIPSNLSLAQLIMRLIKLRRRCRSRDSKTGAAHVLGPDFFSRDQTHAFIEVLDPDLLSLLLAIGPPAFVAPPNSWGGRPTR